VPFEKSPVESPIPGFALGMGGESITQSRSTRGSGAVIKLEEVVMLLDLHRQRLTV
jgi:hypothetical protein